MTDEVLKKLYMDLPDRLTFNNINYVKTENGYVDERFANDKDVLKLYF